jgi:hypothetical protein
MEQFVVTNNTLRSIYICIYNITKKKVITSSVVLLIIISRSPRVNILASLYVRKCVLAAKGSGLPNRHLARSKNSRFSILVSIKSRSSSASTFSYISSS